MALSWRRPTLDTPFHIDMSWWDGQGRDIRVYVREMVCDECREIIREYGADETLDAVDENTGEVTQEDVLLYSLRSCCGLKPEFIEPHTPIIEAIFRTFLLNGNTPLTIRELHALVGRRPPETILRMLTAGDVFMGLRPIRE
jgi:hypothetical protein